MTPQAEARIGIDGYNLALAQGTGVATYARNLAAAVRELGHPLDLIYGLDVRSGPAAGRETLFFSALDSTSVPAGGALQAPSPLKRLRRALISPRTRTLIEVPRTGRVIARGLEARVPPSERLFSLGGLFGLCARYFRTYGQFMPVRVAEPPAIMHWTYPLPIRMIGARNLYTIHDLIPLRLPYTSLEDKRYHERLIRTCLTTADHIITVSEASRRDILDLFPDTDPTRVTNTYQAVTAPDAALGIPQDELERKLRTLFDLEYRGYFLFYGALEPKKNLGRLIEAYLTADLATPLVIVGAGGWKAEGEFRLLNGAHGVRLKGADRIRRIDYLPTDMLMLLARGAKALTFPSLYEGFGLPVLEALTLSTPVLTSTTSSLPELLGEAGVMVDPYDIGAIAEGLRKIDRQQGSKIQKDFLSKFSIENYATQINNLYSLIMKNILIE